MLGAQLRLAGPAGRAAAVHPDNPAFASRLDVDEFAFITHSLGSRITTDGLTRLTLYVERAGPDQPGVPARRGEVAQSRHQDLHAGQPAAPAPERPGARGRPGRVPAFCRPEGADFANRLFQVTELIAFSDPNDLLELSDPDAFVRDHVDSRSAPSRSTSRSTSGPPCSGLASSPTLTAHVDYDDDERVIG